MPRLFFKPAYVAGWVGVFCLYCYATEGKKKNKGDFSERHRTIPGYVVVVPEVRPADAGADINQVPEVNLVVLITGLYFWF